MSDKPGGPSSVAQDIKIDKKKAKKYEENKVYQADFLRALDEIRPAFGVDNDDLESRVAEGIYSYGPNFDKFYNKCEDFIGEIKVS